MNFLAHIYLSGSDPYIQLGNFMADAVKGNAYSIYAENVQKGILLHRFIDSFTDNDPVHRISKRRLHPRYRHYAGVIIDIFYDHFLARNWHKFSDENLAGFTARFYNLLEANLEIMPARIEKFTPVMIKYDWLGSYAHFEGIAQILNGMNTRTKGVSKMDQSIGDLKAHYSEFESDFFDFFPRLEKASKNHLNKLLSNSI